MGARKSPNISSDRQKWNHIFNALVQMLQTQQSQLKFLEDRLKLQHERWISDVMLSQEQLSQMRRKINVLKMEGTVEAAKSDLFMGLKQTETLMYKLKAENTQSELADFKELFDLLSHACSETNDLINGVSKKGEEQRQKALENELRRLKHENEKLGSKKSSELCAILSERDFVWNQYKKMESDFTVQLSSKHAEVEEANEKIQNLLAGMEQLQTSNTEKEDLIVSLKTDMAKLESESLKKKEEISRMSRELELLRKARSDSVTPVLHRCKEEAGRSQSGGQKKGVHKRNCIIAKTEVNSSQAVKKGSRNSKRKTVESTSISEIPKLFTSTFKVPKLKTASSPCVT